VATLILPADVSWSEGASPAAPPILPPLVPPAGERIEAVCRALRGAGNAAILLGGRALREPGLMAAARVASATGARLICEVFPARFERGAGLPSVERLAYVPELASTQLAGLTHLILADAKSPVTFFAYPGKDSDLVPSGCDVLELAEPAGDPVAALEAVASAIGSGSVDGLLSPARRPQAPTGALTGDSVCQAIGAVLPEGAIISDEAQTSGVKLAAATAGAPRHDLLALTGGAIGQGLPVAVGAAIACPDRPVLALVADGSSLYTIQSLWTMAREGLDVTVVIFNNRSYGILNVELSRVGARAAGPKARAQLDLGDPDVDFVSLARGFGIPASQADSGEDLVAALRVAFARPGPHLVEVVIPTMFTPGQLRAMPYALGALGKLPRPLAAALKRRLYP